MGTVPVHAGTGERMRLYRAGAFALIAETMLLAGVCAWLSHKTAVAPPPPPTLLSLAPPDIPKPPAPPQPAPPKPVTPIKPVVPPKAVEHLHRVTRAAAPKPTPEPAPAPAPALPTATPTDPPATPAAAPPPPPAPPAAAQHADPSFESALRAAIQAALRYPESARLAGMNGRVRVAFDYLDGRVSNVRLVASSGVGMLDRAALAAVHDANYPKPASALAGKTLSEQLWITFNLNDQE
jgi:protein TonB